MVTTIEKINLGCLFTFSKVKSPTVHKVFVRGNLVGTGLSGCYECWPLLSHNPDDISFVPYNKRVFTGFEIKY